LSGPGYYECSMFVENDEKLELRCPRCGCPKLIFEEGSTKPAMEFGEKVTCYECRYEFVVTENCWEIVDDRR
jgi:ssDNA-binding Zn-finger/Zn-ribbon topoisomerase 1